MNCGINFLNDSYLSQNFINESNPNSKKIAIIFDYDKDNENNCYSGEFLICSSKYTIKAGGIESVCINDTQSIYPNALIPALGLVCDIYKEEADKHLPKHFNNYNTDSALEKINQNIINRKSDIKSFFRAAAFLMDLDENEMKQQAAQNLKKIKNEYEFNIRYTNKMFILGTKDIILGLLNDIKKDEKKEIMAAKFYKSIIDISVFICKDLREFYGIGKVLLAGKMFAEDENLRLIEDELKRSGFDVISNFYHAAEKLIE